jgi:hypothetical protein
LYNNYSNGAEKSIKNLFPIVLLACLFVSFVSPS